MRLNSIVQLMVTMLLAVALIGQATFLSRMRDQPGHDVPSVRSLMPSFMRDRLIPARKAKEEKAAASAAAVRDNEDDGVSSGGLSDEDALDALLGGGVQLPVTKARPQAVKKPSAVAKPGMKGKDDSESACDGWECVDAVQGQLGDVAVVKAAKRDETGGRAVPAKQQQEELAPPEFESELPSSSPSRSPKPRKPAVAASPPAPAPQSAPSVLGGHTATDLLCEGRAAAGSLPAGTRDDMAAFIRAGGRLPILIVTSDRAEMLRRTLADLLPPTGRVRCVGKEDVVVIADGEDEGVKAVIAAAGVASHHHVREPWEGGLDGAGRIASHYRYALAHALDVSFPHAPGVIVVEDDFLFAPDFYAYFHAAAFALEASRDSLWVASAWNDNGFDYLVADPAALRRTSYFPGLGWLLPRRVWAGELAGSWPDSHWDHWMRDPARRRGRDVVIPEVPRVYHAGVRGTFMDKGTHNALFGSIALQDDAGFSWDSPQGAAAVEGLGLGAYEARLRAALGGEGTRHIGADGLWRGAKGSPLEALLALQQPGGWPVVLWYDCPINQHNHDPMRPLARFLGIWHEGGRGSRGGVHEMWWGPGHAHLFTVNVNDGSGAGPHNSGTIEAADGATRGLMPRGLQPVQWTAFRDDPLARSRPLLPKHSGLFGGKFASPLAHLEGGADGNGPPDSDSAAAVAGAPVARPPLPPAHAGQSGPGHVHDVFMADLTETTPEEGAGAGSGHDGGGEGGGSASIPGEELGGGDPYLPGLPQGVIVVPASGPGFSCDDVCAAAGIEAEGGAAAPGNLRGGVGGAPSGGWQCSEEALPFINTCRAMKAHLPCKRCVESQGTDQPAYVGPNGPVPDHRESCLVNNPSAPFACAGMYKFTQRLCPCVKG